MERPIRFAAVTTVALLVVASCAVREPARHVAVSASTGLYTALAAVDDLERDLYARGTVTDAEHVSLGATILELLKTGRAINTVIDAWPTTTVSAPPELVPLVTDLRVLADHLLNVVGNPETRATLAGAIAVANQIAVSVLESFAPPLPPSPPMFSQESSDEHE